MGGPICLDYVVRTAILLGRGSSVGRHGEVVQVPHVSARSRNRTCTEENRVGNASVSNICWMVNLTHRSFRYPFAYSLIVLPLSVTRWLQFSKVDIPSAATFFGVSLFNLSGAVNVLVFLIARPGLLLFTRPKGHWKI